MCNPAGTEKYIADLVWNLIFDAINFILVCAKCSVKENEFFALAVYEKSRNWDKETTRRSKRRKKIVNSETAHKIQ